MIDTQIETYNELLEQKAIIEARIIETKLSIIELSKTEESETHKVKVITRKGSIDTKALLADENFRDYIIERVTLTIDGKAIQKGIEDGSILKEEVAFRAGSTILKLEERN